MWEAEVSLIITARHLRQACRHAVSGHALMLQPGHCLPGGPCGGSQGTPLLGVIGMLGVMPVMGPGGKLGIIYLQVMATIHGSTSTSLQAETPHMIWLSLHWSAPVCSCSSSQQQHRFATSWAVQSSSPALPIALHHA